MPVTILDRFPTGESDEWIAMITTGVNHACVFFAAIVIPLTSLVLGVLMRRQAYSLSPFFTICKVGLAFDIVSLLMQLIFRAFPSYGWFAYLMTETPFPAKLTYFFIYFTRSGQALTNLFICVNRASAILLPLFHEKIWHNAFLLPAFIVSEVVISIVLGFMAGSFDVQWIRYPQGQLYSAMKQGSNLRVFLRAVFVPVLGILVVIIVLYIGITYQFRSRHVSVHKKESKAPSSVEKKQASSLFYIAVCSVAMEVAEAIV